jgi:hypothetical protein
MLAFYLHAVLDFTEKAWQALGVATQLRSWEGEMELRSDQISHQNQPPRARNPYIAGNPISSDAGFFGRKDILVGIEAELSSADRNAVVLFGQRRIGKTSILLQLQRWLASAPLKLVYFDLMDLARQALGKVLLNLAATIAAEVGIPIPKPDQSDDIGEFFRCRFLPEVYEALGHKRRLVLLLDEFDVFDVAAEERLAENAAARSFFPYLRALMKSEPRLAFVFVVGRKADDLSIDVKATFKATRSFRVSVLDESSARNLASSPKRVGSFRY